MNKTKWLNDLTDAATRFGDLQLKGNWSIDEAIAYARANSTSTACLSLISGNISNPDPDCDFWGDVTYHLSDIRCELCPQGTFSQ